MEAVQGKFEKVEEKDFKKFAIDKEDGGLFYKQALANSGPIIIALTSGMTGGFSSIIIAQLQQKDSFIKTSASQNSWIATLTHLAMTIGCLLNWLFLQLFSRKTTQSISLVIGALGWMNIFFATGVELLFAGQFFGGFSIGLSAFCIAGYIGEIPQINYRRSLQVLLVVSFSIGFLLEHFIGAFVHWKALALINFSVAGAALIPFWYSPESYVWYIDKKLEELERLNEQNHSHKYPLLEKLKNCCKSHFIKPLLIVNLYFATLQFTGNNVISYYTIAVMESTVLNLNSYVAMLIIDVVRLIAAGATCILITTFKVRLPTMISGFGAVLSLILLSTFLYLNDNNPEVYKNLPILCLIFYQIFVNIGLAPLSWVVCGEFFPAKLSDIGVGVSIFTNFAISTIIVKSFPVMLEFFGIPGTFICYSVATFLGTTILFFVLSDAKRDVAKNFMVAQENI